MQTASRYRIVSIVVCTAVAAFVALSACSNYEEGERCEVLNGNEDCKDGLQCTPKAQINTPYDSSDRCCPVDRTTATHPACVVLTTPITTDAAPLDSNTGPTPDATIDTGTDTSPPQEAGTDAADAAEGG
jgi:hypothetical protein